ncbi:MAG TPA: type IV pili methyl-accepting chemotaxis transducer N-terminal domain-containing protein, partial [Kofleriaceae bacterium]|nr:type IV pili methyl-accepting chemotaxis transducer N-terminal domain-containing protein [Kofleriaceae bacterium]
MRRRLLSFRYVGALLVVAGLLISGQTVIHQLLARQRGDARVINLAGRQRMLSQRLCTLALKLKLELESGERARDARSELSRTAAAWQRTQAVLRDGSPDSGPGELTSQPIRQLFADIDPHHRAMLDAARGATDRPGASDTADASGTPGIPGETGIAAYARSLCDHQEAFLAGMDRIVAAYEHEAEQRVIGLERLER